MLFMSFMVKNSSYHEEHEGHEVGSPLDERGCVRLGSALSPVFSG